MNNDSAEAREIRATANSFERPGADLADDRLDQSGPADAEIIDADAIIIDERPVPDEDMPAEADNAAAGLDEDAVLEPDDPLAAGPADDTAQEADDTLAAGPAENAAPEADGARAAGLAEDAAGPADDRRVVDTAEDMPVVAADRVRAETAGGQHESPRMDLAGDAGLMRERWVTIQSGFVDDPRASVLAAADLVSEAISTLVSTAQERERGLRAEWDRDGVDTEGLRHTLRNYRNFLDRLVTL